MGLSPKQQTLFGETLDVESESVKFIAKPLNLWSSTVKLLLIHYVEDKGYQLPFIGTEVILKVARNSYPALLRWIKEDHLIVKVEKDKVTLVEPYQKLQPIPKYIYRRDGGELTVTSRGDIIQTVYLRLSSLPYHTFHEYYGKRHEIYPKEMLELRELECGCCSKLIIKKVAWCSACTRFYNVEGKILGYWALFKSNIHVSEPFGCKLDGNKVVVSTEKEEILTRKVDDIIRDMF